MFNFWPILRLLALALRHRAGLDIIHQKFLKVITHRVAILLELPCLFRFHFLLLRRIGSSFNQLQGVELSLRLELVETASDRWLNLRWYRKRLLRGAKRGEIFHLVAGFVGGTEVHQPVFSKWWDECIFFVEQVFV